MSDCTLSVVTVRKTDFDFVDQAMILAQATDFMKESLREEAQPLGQMEAKVIPQEGERGNAAHWRMFPYLTRSRIYGTPH